MAMAVRSGHGQLAGHAWIKRIRGLVTCDVQKIADSEWAKARSWCSSCIFPSTFVPSNMHWNQDVPVFNWTSQLLCTLITLWSLVLVLDLCRRYPHGFLVHIEADCVALGHRLKMTIILCRRPKSSERIKMHLVPKLAIFICATSQTQFSSWGITASSLIR
jgi:hypothetical protein